MNARKIVGLALPAGVALCCLWLVEPVYSQSSTQDPSAATNASSANSTDSTKGTKEKHWSGDLVDAGCMAGALGNGGTAAPVSGPGAGAQHFSGFAAEPAAMQQGQAGSGGGASSAPAVRDPNGPPTGSANSPDSNAQDQAREQQEQQMNAAVRKCAPTASTQKFGLVMGNGQVMQFDADGNAKASEALKENPAEPGKKVKAKVEGTMEDNTTVRVASVDIKAKSGKHAHPSS